MECVSCQLGAPNAAGLLSTAPASQRHKHTHTQIHHTLIITPVITSQDLVPIIVSISAIEDEKYLKKIHMSYQVYTQKHADRVSTSTTPPRDGGFKDRHCKEP